MFFDGRQFWHFLVFLFPCLARTVCFFIKKQVLCVTPGRFSPEAFDQPRSLARPRVVYFVLFVLWQHLVSSARSKILQFSSPTSSEAERCVRACSPAPWHIPTLRGAGPCVNLGQTPWLGHASPCRKPLSVMTMQLSSHLMGCHSLGNVESRRFWDLLTPRLPMECVAGGVGSAGTAATAGGGAAASVRPNVATSRSKEKLDLNFWV